MAYAPATTTQVIARKIIGHRAMFFLSFALIFTLSYGLLSAVGFVPEQTATNASMVVEGGGAENLAPPVFASDGLIDDTPRRIIADSIGVNAEIINPISRDIDVLDEALRHGVVHYPGSGELEDNSNMFLFGHSSHLPVVQNELYRVFNNLSKLKEGDVIRMQANGYEYRYRVSSVELVDANEALVELSNREKKLTLSTCNSFGSQDDRFVVEADFVERVALGA